MRLYKNAGNQWKSCWRQVEMFKRELEGSKNQAENKTRECLTLVNELKCLARELKNAKEDIKNFISRVKTEQKSGNITQSRLEARKVQSPFGNPPYLYELLFLPKGATTITILKEFKTLSPLRHPDKGGRQDFFKNILQTKNVMEYENLPKFL